MPEPLELAVQVVRLTLWSRDVVVLALVHEMHDLLPEAAAEVVQLLALEVIAKKEAARGNTPRAASALDLMTYAFLSMQPLNCWFALSRSGTGKATREPYEPFLKNVPFGYALSCVRPY